MIHKIRKEKVYESNHGWLHSRFLFSFAEYFDEGNMSWGALRVFNDDTLLGESGFPSHSHKEMEIVTIINKGTLTHDDSMGNKREISQGYVQRMSAGTGVTHSELNHGKETVELYQLWFFPNKKELTPEYEEKKFEEKKGLTLLVSESGKEGSVTIHANVSIYNGLIEKGEEMEIPLENDDMALVYIKEGKVFVGEELYGARDQARIENEKSISLRGEEKSEFLVVVSRGIK